MRSFLVGAVPLLALVTIGCGKPHQAGPDAAGDSAPIPDACEGLQCFQVDCGAKGLPPTTISGTVYAPNGTLPLYNVNVYVPSIDPGPIADGARCDRCDAALPGAPIASAVTDEAGHFTLPNVPATGDVPIVIQSGKWRRELKIPNVAACQDLPIPALETTFPKSRTDLTPYTTRVNMPSIAVTTGGADALECLIRKLGIDDTEFTTDAQGGKVNLFNGNGASSFAAGFAGGTGAFPDATTLWGTTDKAAAMAKLDDYDIVMLSCEGGQGPGTKSQVAMDAVHDYAGLGGRLFMSHWHNIWIGGEDGNLTHGLPDWQAVATFDYAAAQNEASQLTVIDETVPKGTSFATWMLNVGGSTTRGQVNVDQPRYTCAANDPTKSDRRVYVDPTLSTPLGKVSLQDLEFTTPQSAAPADRCGKVVFSDMHVASGSSSSSGTPFPGGCLTGDLTPQEKALAFIFFDISSCVGPIQ
ncbi:MAG: carboxypeptidase regulatory-like domain-containing protein [Proteobacteria bacterium]|nr:carboxypeptidase regulatory-like domain-containing protein [Pseudomonadota bacterium]